MSEPITLTQWLPCQKSDFDPFWRPWLNQMDSLTNCLVERAKGDFYVKVLNEGLTYARNDEHSALSVCEGDIVWAREVLLFGIDQPWVYARTLMPKSIIEGPLNEFTRLGNRPLGAVLFNSEICKRGPIEAARAGISGIDTIRPSRRSCFYYANHPIVVAECFLPAFEEVIQPERIPV